jgi:hnRNP-L/PTB/hephaestus splicing factor
MTKRTLNGGGDLTTEFRQQLSSLPQGFSHFPIIFTAIENVIGAVEAESAEQAQIEQQLAIGAVGQMLLGIHAKRPRLDNTQASAPCLSAVKLPVNPNLTLLADICHAGVFPGGNRAINTCNQPETSQGFPPSAIGSLLKDHPKIAQTYIQMPNQHNLIEELIRSSSIMNDVTLAANQQYTQSSSVLADGGQAKISRVVHLRNIPDDMTELELLHFCAPFGRLSNYLMLKGKNQAFVEYESEAGAQQLVNVAAQCPMSIRGRTMFCQYSLHQQLKVESRRQPGQIHTSGDEACSLALDEHSDALLLPHREYPNEDEDDESNLLVLGSGSNDAGTTGENGPTVNGSLHAQSDARDALSATRTTPLSQQQSELGGGQQTQPSSVLRVIIDNMIYPVTLDVLYAIFSRYGKVLRIITFNKNNTFQALVQLSEANAAQNARQGLDGQNVYNGCCTLRIDYSKLITLNVKYNNDKSRDYTNPNLPAGELTFEQQISLVSAAAHTLPGHHGAMGFQPALSLAGVGAAPYGTLHHAQAPGAFGQPGGLAQSLDGSTGQNATLTMQSLQGLPGMQGAQHALNPLAPLQFNPFATAGLTNMTNPAAAAVALHFQQQLGGLLLASGANASGVTSLSPAASAVVLVSNLDENVSVNYRVMKNKCFLCSLL